ncbi:hypothetical protein [Sphingobium boeckii]|uniref:Uncharacterized protein n=1 Tax=Sphingobium boeckii TaxID=1082345 RepID=A0A7W9AFP7_9SPHN|nr:hypothetical protein [Sphingobium boeckii]MBB5684733.1 hypothetical protein [Sphingobium boeckii]
MNQQSASSISTAPVTPGTQIGELRAILGLVHALAGNEMGIDRPEMTDADVRYAAAAPLVRRRFDALASETAAFSATGLSALIGGRERGNTKAAAAYLARSMDRAIVRMEKMLG